VKNALASALAIRTGWELAGRASSWVMKLGQLNRQELTERVEAFTHLMQQAFVDEFRSNPDFGDSGTTWSAAYFVSSFAVVFNIGDSPCFLWRNGIMCRVSTDHTVEQEFMAAGVDREIAGRYGHMLTRCLGYDSQNARPDVYHLRLKPGDQVLLCTDGLTDMISDVDIAQCLDDSPNAQSACDSLIQRALAAGGRDNVTAV
jgi:serine/threonine protein phosphatase PrpC